MAGVDGTNRDAPSAARSRLRSARIARSLSQQQLAALAGVSRQAVAAVEAERSEPSLRLALTLAEALGMTVESLFGADTSIAPITGEALAEVGPVHSRAALVTVGTRVVAAPLRGDAGSRSGFAPATALVTPDPGAFAPLAPLRPTVVVAGCDPALSLLETPLAHLDPPFAFLWRSCGSREALELAAAGLVHAAGIHVRDDAPGRYNHDALARIGSGPHRLVGFASWRQGLAMRADLAETVGGLEDAVNLGLRLVNREAGSEARSVIDRIAAAAGVRAETIPGYGAEVHGHLDVAAAIANGLADFGVASEPAALAYGLAFVALTDERFDLVVTPGLGDTPEVQALVRVLTSPWLRRQLQCIDGYDALTCGERVDLGTSRT
jgi:molybdate-binding protein/DNA-binding XRE family transcriptional regulator